MLQEDDVIVTWQDYVSYFFTGVKKEGMSAFWLSVLKAVQYVVVAFIAIVLQQVYDSLVKGTFELFNWVAWQSYLLPGFIFVVGFLNELFRKAANPAVSVKYVPNPIVRTPVQPNRAEYMPNVSIRHVDPPDTEEG